MKPLIKLTTVFALLALTGCGTSGSSASSTAHRLANGEQVVALAADPSGSLAYTTDTLHASAGELQIDFTNKSPMSHNVTVSSANGEVLGATPTFDGGTRTLTLNLRSGVYDFYCSVPGHREAGMQGTLIVK